MAEKFEGNIASATYFTGPEIIFGRSELGDLLLDDNNETYDLNLEFWAKKEFLEYQKSPKNTKDNFKELCALVQQRSKLSAERVSMGGDIIYALDNAGYRLLYLDNKEPRFNYLDSSEVEKDQRSPVYFVLKNGVGSSVAFSINPDYSQTKNNISMQILFDDSDTEDRRHRATRDINGVLSEYGFDDFKIIGKDEKIDEELRSKRYDN